MIHEYAIEPSVLLDWAESSRDYEEFLREYGLGTPRLLSSFPKTRLPKLKSYLLNNSPADQQSIIYMRYTEMVDKIVENLVLRNTECQSNGDWFSDVVEEHETVPFDVIISSNTLGLPNSCTVNNMYNNSSPWRHSNQLNIKRTFDSFASSVLNMLRLSTEHVVFVDPFGWTEDSIATTSNLLNKLCEKRINQMLPLITFFFKKSFRGGEAVNPNATYVKLKILESLSVEASQLIIEVKELETSDDSDVFHNRCILTELAGVQTGHGISLTNNPQHTDEATLMNAEIYQKKWSQFIEEPEFLEVSSSV